MYRDHLFHLVHLGSMTMIVVLVDLDLSEWIGFALYKKEMMHTCFSFGTACTVRTRNTY
jgi:hypothetical protein